MLRLEDRINNECYQLLDALGDTYDEQQERFTRLLPKLVRYFNVKQ